MSNKRNLTPPPTVVDIDKPLWKKWISAWYDRYAGEAITVKGYAKANLPEASNWASSTAGNEFSSIIYVTDDATGAQLAYSDGSNWKRVIDGTTVA